MSFAWFDILELSSNYLCKYRLNERRKFVGIFIGLNGKKPKRAENGLYWLVFSKLRIENDFSSAYVKKKKRLHCFLGHICFKNGLFLEK